MHVTIILVFFITPVYLSTCLLRTWSLLNYQVSHVTCHSSQFSYPVCLVEYTKNKRQGYYIIKYPMSLYTHYYPVFLITPAYLSAENARTTTRQRKNQASYVTVISVNFNHTCDLKDSPMLSMSAKFWALYSV
jgi:hypothetical protein